ncbi:MAG: CDP-glucose 4,6-dehydratase [Nitrospirota bacterium]|nr:CDP-glucose 4,6-dehydratase [Nitrospirota bacterium]
MNPEFWKGKRVLITGHTGFKGGWLSLWLQRVGAEVIGYALEPPTTPNLFDAASVAQGMTSVHGDVRNLDHLASTLIKHKPEIVFHMAAQSLVRTSYDEPVETYAVNVMGTVNLLEAVRQYGGIRVVINVTSDKCYENSGLDRGYSEDDPMGGYDPYSSSKGCAELVTAAYRRSFFHDNSTAVASVRAGNVIGGGDWADYRLLPDIMKALMNGQVVKIRNPHSVRPWQHVLEPLNGYLCLAERLWEDGRRFADGWNFGPADEDARPVSWIVERATALWGEATLWEQDGIPQPHEAHTLRLDSAKARNLLGWSPELDLAEALEWTVHWYKQFQRDKSSVRLITEEQIDRFLAKGNS